MIICMKKIYNYHVLQADETPVLVSKENRTKGSKHYMWVYRTGKMYPDKQIVLYEYQPSRNASHPRAFLKDFKGVCVTDGYQVYHTIEKNVKTYGLLAAGHMQDADLTKQLRLCQRTGKKVSLAYLALKVDPGNLSRRKQTCINDYRRTSKTSSANRETAG